MTTQEANACATGQECAAQYKPSPARPINCDQVAWLKAAISRCLPPSRHPDVSREREMKVYGLLYEIMEVAHLHFEDEAAQHNGTPPDVRRFRYASKQDECQANKTTAPGSLQAARQAIREVAP